MIAQVKDKLCDRSSEYKLLRKPKSISEQDRSIKIKFTNIIVRGFSILEISMLQLCPEDFKEKLRFLISVYIPINPQNLKSSCETKNGNIDALKTLAKTSPSSANPSTTIQHATVKEIAKPCLETISNLESLDCDTYVAIIQSPSVYDVATIVKPTKVLHQAQSVSLDCENLQSLPVHNVATIELPLHYEEIKELSFNDYQEAPVVKTTKVLHQAQSIPLIATNIMDISAPAAEQLNGHIENLLETSTITLNTNIVDSSEFATVSANYITNINEAHVSTASDQVDNAETISIIANQELDVSTANTIVNEVLVDTSEHTNSMKLSNLTASINSIDSRTAEICTRPTFIQTPSYCNSKKSRFTSISANINDSKSAFPDLLDQAYGYAYIDYQEMSKKSNDALYKKKATSINQLLKVHHDIASLNKIMCHLLFHKKHVFTNEEKLVFSKQLEQDKNLLDFVNQINDGFASLQEQVDQTIIAKKHKDSKKAIKNDINQETQDDNINNLYQCFMHFSSKFITEKVITKYINNKLDKTSTEGTCLFGVPIDAFINTSNLNDKACIAWIAQTTINRCNDLIQHSQNKIEKRSKSWIPFVKFFNHIANKKETSYQNKCEKIKTEMQAVIGLLKSLT